MLAASYEAIRHFLATTFPDVTGIYNSTMPAGFARPSFYLELVLGIDDERSEAIYNSQATWEIVYFAPVDENFIPDTVSQLQVADTIKKIMAEKMIVVHPDGTVFSVLGCEGGPRDSEVYINLKLELDVRAPGTEYDLMKDIQHNVDGVMQEVEYIQEEG